MRCSVKTGRDGASRTAWQHQLSYPARVAGLALHQDELLENWRLARAGETLREIDPLR